MTATPIFTIGAMLLIASLVAMLSRRLRLPYSVGLVSAGILLAFFPRLGIPPLTSALIYNVLLPPLVFEAALQLRWREFRRNLPLTAMLALPGVALATLAVAACLHALLGWTWQGALLFGVLIAATDPVSVIAAFKEMRVDARLRMVVESESLLNDGTAAVGFTLLTATVVQGTGTAPLLAVPELFAWIVAGGVTCGIAVAGALLLLAWRTQDHLVEITLTTIAAYGSFLIAEHFHMSGVIASLSAGLLVGNWGLDRAISPAGRGHVQSFWDYAAFLANSVVFLLIGSQAAQEVVPRAAQGAALAIALALGGRALAVYPFCAVFGRSRIRLGRAEQHVLVWGGLRGALALALALAVPEGLAERRDMILFAFAVTAFSIFVQGLTVPWLVRRLGLTGQAPPPR